MPNGAIFLPDKQFYDICPCKPLAYDNKVKTARHQVQIAYARMWLSKLAELEVDLAVGPETIKMRECHIVQWRPKFALAPANITNALSRLVRVDVLIILISLARYYPECRLAVYIRISICVYTRAISH